MEYEHIYRKFSEIESCRHVAKPVVAAYGMMNAGKSFLLNMLTQHLEQG